MRTSRVHDASNRAGIAATVTAILLLTGCGNSTKPTDTNNNPPGAVPTYTADVGPIISEGCTCHQPGGIKFSSVPLDTYAHVLARKDRVKLRAGVQGSMPPTGPLSQAQRQTIIAWVDGGAPE